MKRPTKQLTELNRQLRSFRKLLKEIPKLEKENPVLFYELNNTINKIKEDIKKEVERLWEQKQHPN